MNVVVLDEQPHLARAFGLPSGFERLDLGERCLVHLRHEHLLGISVIGRDARHHVGDDQAPEVLLVAEGA